MNGWGSRCKSISGPWYVLFIYLFYFTNCYLVPDYVMGTEMIPTTTNTNTLGRGGRWVRARASQALASGMYFFYCFLFSLLNNYLVTLHIPNSYHSDRERPPPQPNTMMMMNATSPLLVVTSNVAQPGHNVEGKPEFLERMRKGPCVLYILY